MKVFEGLAGIGFVLGMYLFVSGMVGASIINVQLGATVMMMNLMTLALLRWL